MRFAEHRHRKGITPSWLEPGNVLPDLGDAPGRDLDLAFGIIVLLWIFIVLTLRAFWREHRPSGIFFIPYLAWVTFASVLNFTIWKLNP